MCELHRDDMHGSKGGLDPSHRNCGIVKKIDKLKMMTHPSWNLWSTKMYKVK
jgi:hypothetical protein